MTILPDRPRDRIAEAEFYALEEARHDAEPWDEADWQDEYRWEPSADDEAWWLEVELDRETVYPWERSIEEVEADLDRAFATWEARLRSEGRLDADGRITDHDHAAATGCV